MDKRGNILIGFVILIAAVLGVLFFSINRHESQSSKQPAKQTTKAVYKPQINPSDFTDKITNEYFTMPVGKKLVYEAQTKDGPEKVEIEMAGQTKSIMGVTTTLYHDTVYLNGQLHEDTKDWLAQDKSGTVWYFGEDVDNYEKGKLVDNKGTFTAGVDGAQPGIWIRAKQKVGDSYRQEYYKGKAEDMRNVVAVNQTVVTKLATYKGCVKFYDWTPLEPASKENKYYCPEVASEVVSEHLTENKRAELTSIVLP